ncbi:MAG: hypothetical protein AAF666_19500 [Pseudomonadota bacterium]
MFTSVWDSLDAVNAQFGQDWRVSYLPERYEDLIETCGVRHFDMSGGWELSEG